LMSLDTGLGLSDTQNAEIARTWFIQVATRRFEPAYGQMEAHLNRHGRARLITPIYGALASNGHDVELANSLFEQARSAYHPLTSTYIERTLKTAAEKQ
jgi:leukotriene-A4 hydrolase